MCGKPDIPEPPPAPPPPAPPPAPTDIRDPITDPTQANQAAKNKQKRTGRKRLQIDLGSIEQSGGKSGLAIGK